MGNWRTVTIQGTCPPDQLDALREACNPHRGEEYANWDCLSVGSSIMGLGDWTGEHIDSSGNLSERDYDVEDVAKALKRIVGEVPGLQVKVHCGADREDKKCIATVTVAGGEVTVGPPEVDRIRGASGDEVAGRFAKSIFGI